MAASPWPSRAPTARSCWRCSPEGAAGSTPGWRPAAGPDRLESPPVPPATAIHLRPTAPLAERVLLPGDPGRALELRPGPAGGAAYVQPPPRPVGLHRDCPRRRAADDSGDRHGRPIGGDRAVGADRPRRQARDPCGYVRRAHAGAGPRRTCDRTGGDLRGRHLPRVGRRRAGERRPGADRSAGPTRPVGAARARWQAWTCSTRPSNTPRRAPRCT